MQESIVDIWASGDTERLEGLLAEDIVFSSPVGDYASRTLALHLLSLAAQVLGDVSITGRWDGEGDRLSAFTARVGGQGLDGVLREQLGGSGSLVQVTLFLRPYRALNEVINRMRAVLSENPCSERRASPGTTSKP